MPVPAEDERPVVRLARMRALPGRLPELLAAAHENVTDAMAADGCLSAEVCSDPASPDGILVVSRWVSAAALHGFLAWHEQIAHTKLADFARDRPAAAHHPVLASGA